MTFQEKMIIRQELIKLSLKLWNTETVLKLNFDLCKICIVIF
jgi:hypothetical protein